VQVAVRNKRFRVRVSRTRWERDVCSGHALLTAHPLHREADNTAVKTFFMIRTPLPAYSYFYGDGQLVHIGPEKRGGGLLSVVGCCRLQAIALVDYFIAPASPGRQQREIKERRLVKKK
jgi:hypothetical protein